MSNNNQIPRKKQALIDRIYPNQRNNTRDWNSSTSSSSWSGRSNHNLNNNRFPPINNGTNSSPCRNRAQVPPHANIQSINFPENRGTNGMDRAIDSSSQHPPHKNSGGNHRHGPRKGIDNRPAWVIREENENNEVLILEEGSFGTLTHTANTNKTQEEMTDMAVDVNKDFESLPMIDKIKGQIMYSDFTLLDEALAYFSETNLKKDWINLKHEAMKTALKETLIFMNVPTIDDDDDAYHSEESSDVPMSDEDNYHVHNSKKRNRNKWDHSEDEVESFLVCLCKNYAFDLGFHAFGQHPDDERNCWCPMSRHMKSWKVRCYLEFDFCTSKGRTLPSALIKHLEAKAEPVDSALQKPCLLHYATLIYLRTLYSNVNNGLGSKHLYNVGDDNYNRVVAYEKKIQNIMFKRMSAENKALRQKAEEADEKLKQMNQLEKTNKELYTKVKEMEQIKEKYGIIEKKKEELTSEQIDQWNRAIRVNLDSIQKVVGNLLQTNEVAKASSKAKHKGIEIKILQSLKSQFDRDAPFDLQHLFDKTYERFKNGKKDSTFLFDDLKSDDRKIDNTWKWMAEWSINFSNSDGTKKEIINVDAEDKAVDKGGPTREFLAQVWKQMGHLKIKDELGPVTDNCFLDLFDENSNYYAPQADEYIDSKLNKIIQKKISGEGMNAEKEHMKEDLLLQVKRYYRSLGRIMYRAISSGNSILETAVSTYYLNVIFRGMEPKDETYELGALLDDIFSADENKSVLTYFKKIPKEEARQTMQENYFENKMIAISALREGFTLNDSVGIMPLLKVMSTDAVRQCLFEKSSITADDIIRLLVANYEPLNRLSNKDVLREECQKFFENELKSLIRDRAKQKRRSKEDKKNGVTCGQEFLRLFLSFCTGSQHIPYRASFNIIVEFNKDENEHGMNEGSGALPVAHTCERILKLPGEIYRNKEEFAKKLDQSLTVVGSFGIS